ncbi:uncharacterized protein LOC130334535 [Hyla sarda]|uniref:uncharacterized protein LOC130334535 n=1 Tax=Hyla sarda TaxID=327740 RepID=UPI0024C2BF2E|nr:uncharacterized protein LOC130334535 [Hyla sarda]
MGPSLPRHVRFTSELPNTTIFQLETRSRGSGGRCFPPILASTNTLCLSSFQSYSSSSSSNFATEVNYGPHHTLVAHSIMVPSTSTSLNRLPPDSSVLSRSSPRSSWQFPPSDLVRSTHPYCLANIGNSGTTSSFSFTTRELLSDAWAPGTRSAYRSAWKVWVRWCSQRDLDPLQASVSDILNFLSASFDSGKAYRTINLYRSAISATHPLIDFIPAGKHPLVCRLLKGIRFRRPPLPKYNSTWDVNLILDLFVSWEDNDSLSLKFLSFKLTVLLCLISIKRISDVRALDISRMQYSPEGVIFTVYRRTKTNLHSVFYPAFPHQHKLCVVRCLRSYELRTQSLRSSSSSQLLISFCRPHRPVSSTTLARWVKLTMGMADIDISTFGAHSTRGAVSTKLFQSGATLSDILKAANWSSDSTFKTFYFKPQSHVSMTLL